jgi:hypothetical protein
LETWKLIVNGIPKSMLSYAHCVREDPTRQGLLYVGTENGIYVSYDDGDNWEPLQFNLPTVSVRDNRGPTPTTWSSPPTGAHSGFSIT